MGTSSALYFLGVPLTIAKKLEQVHCSMGSIACTMSDCLSLDTWAGETPPGSFAVLVLDPRIPL